jgi:uncharacterized membrane protein
LFALLALVFGLVFIAINPPYWGNDGMSQFARAFQVAHGHLLPQEIQWGGKGKSYGGVVPTTAWNLYVHAGADLGSNPAEPAPIVLSPKDYQELGAKPFDDGTRTTVWFTNTAAYSPVPYAPAVIGVWMAEVFHLNLSSGLTLMAVLSFLSFVAAAYLALFVLRKYRLKWLVFSLALIPPALFQMSTITADALTNGLALLFFALFAKSVLMKTRLNRWESVIFIASAIALPLGKPTYVLLTVLLLFVRLDKFGFSLRVARVAKWAGMAVSVALWALWTALSGNTANVLSFYRSDYATSTFGTLPQIKETIAHPIEFVKAVARTFVYRDNFYFENLLGSSNVQVPGSAMLLSGIGVLLTAGISDRLSTTKRQLVALIIVTSLSFVAIFATLYVSFTPVGYYLIDGVQGRYFFPLLPFIAAVVLRLVPVRLGLPSEKIYRGVVLAVGVLTTVALALTIFKYYVVLWG